MAKVPSRTPAEHGAGGDGPQCKLLCRAGVSECGPRLTFSVAMIDIANGCVKKTYKFDFWCNRCVNHHYFLICTTVHDKITLGIADRYETCSP
jgi:hypothetical protein